MAIELSEAYAFCPRCGAAKQPNQPSRPFRCHGCGYTVFFGPVAAVGGIVVNEQGKVLLLVRARDPGKGLLGMPGGFVDPEESAEEALHREVFEEVGVKITNTRFLMTAPNRYLYQGVQIPVVDLFFIAHVSEKQEIAPEQAEVAEWMWTDLTDEVLGKMAFKSNQIALERYRRGV
jgi:NADH pyrophosphatase NudC (nudix superfamily)